MSVLSRLASGLSATLGVVMALACPPANAQPAGWAERWADEVVGTGVAKGQASGAVVSVVQDDRIVALKGYGYADRPGGRPVDPTRDQFQVASVSKTFTAALLAQLLDEGKLASIDDPANRHLRRARLPSWHGQEVTLRQLVTHSAGYEERGFGYFAHGRSATPASGDYLLKATPALVRAPGARVVYANIDPALVGAVLEDVTGETTQQLMTRRLFQPLGMTRSTLNYDPTGGPALVQPWAEGRPVTRDINAPFFAPTGAVQTTGADMAAYMAAMLGGRPDVLSPGAVRRLEAPLAANDAALDPLGMYWYLTRWGPARVVEHAGGLNGAAALVILVPERRLGVFIAWAGGAPPFSYGLLHDSFLSAALGPPPPPTAPPFKSDLSRFTGRYLEERRPHASPEVFFWVRDATTVSATREGLMIGDRGPFIERQPGVFVMKAEPGRQGDVVVIRGDEILQRTNYLRRVSGWTDPAVQLLVAQVAGALLLTGLLAGLWPKGWAKIPAFVAATATALVPIALMAPGPNGSAPIPDMQRGSSLRFDVVSLALLALCVSCVWLVYGLARGAGSNHGGGARARIAALHAALLTLAAGVLAVCLVTWRFTVLMRL